MSRSPHLPRLGPAPRRRGRVERSIDGLAAHLRKLGQADPFTEAQIATARATGAALDRLEADDERSENVVGSVARVHLAIIAELRPVAAAGVDAFDRLLAELSTAGRDASPTSVGALPADATA